MSATYSVSSPPFQPSKPSPLASAVSADGVNGPFKSSIVAPSDVGDNVSVSGNVISASCYIPFTLGFRRNDGGLGTWEISPRRGASALYDSLKHLATPDSKWKHTLLGWTGDITELSKDSEIPEGQHMQNPRTTSAGGQAPTVTPMTRTKSGYQVPPPVPVAQGTEDRMTMKGDYSKQKSEDDDKPRISKEDRQNLEILLQEKSSEAGWEYVKPVWVGTDDNASLSLKELERWTQYADKVLWPTFHYIVPQTFSPAEGSSLRERVWWADYVRLNKAFADAILAIYKPGDIVWIHDYQLLLVPEILRKKLGRDVHIGVFVHSPWPSSEIFRILSHRNEILNAMLTANMVGFQSQTYKDHFVSCCKRILGLEEHYDSNGSLRGVNTAGSMCAVEALPIGIDVDKVRKSAHEEGVAEKMEMIRNSYAGKKIIVGRDRLDSVRGVVQKLRAYQKFLEEYPEWVDKVVMIQVTSPASAGETSEIGNQISELVSHINSTWGSLHFSPIQHYPQHLNPKDYFALLRVADLGLITSVRDSMNTTSLEYIVCQEKSHGPVILSEFTGTAESLTDAILVNPTNTRQVADAIRQCLEMDEDKKKELHRNVFKFVSENDARAWNDKFLRLLIRSLESDSSHPVTPRLDLRMLVDKFNAADKRLFMFDYDGTLTPIVNDPDLAIPTDRVIRTLKSLAQKEENMVWIISGRDQKFLSERLGHIEELGLSAEHGCFMRRPNTSDWVNLADKMDMGWQSVTEKVFQKYTDQTHGSFIEKKLVALTWHYRRADIEFGLHQSKLCRQELQLALKDWDCEVMTGKANLEVRPKALNKGEIVRQLLHEEDGCNFVMCAGDDTTDEDMFRVLAEIGKDERNGEVPDMERVFSVTVGPSSKVTEARWHVPESSDVVDAAGTLVGIVPVEDLW